jgi:hypothetical protein
MAITNTGNAPDRVSCVSSDASASVKSISWPWIAA